MKTWIAVVAGPVLLLSGAVAQAQYQGGNPNFYNGVRDGGRGGSYDSDRYHHHDSGYDQRYAGNDPNYHQGGIGPGKGAAIGGAGGAALGAIFGGGLKGALIGGAAGAGIGAVAGHEHQNSERRDRYYGR